MTKFYYTRLKKDNKNHSLCEEKLIKEFRIQKFNIGLIKIQKYSELNTKGIKKLRNYHEKI